MPEKPRVLFVDDEASLRSTWSAILGGEGFEVNTAPNVTDALSLITTKIYDALIADLNIGQPGDGFTVVSAMRRVQPKAVTMILTGYPAFQAALRAIHEQVDDFLTKPADPENVIGRLRENLVRRRTPDTVLTQRLPQVIAQHRQSIIESWFQAVENNKELSAIKLTREERIDHLPQVLDELVKAQVSETGIDPAMRDSAIQHGITRKKQKYTSSMLLEETRILHRRIADCMQRNLMTIDISNVLPDMVQVHDKLHLMLRYALEAFLSA